MEDSEMNLNPTNSTIEELNDINNNSNLLQSNEPLPLSILEQVLTAIQSDATNNNYQNSINLLPPQTGSSTSNSNQLNETEIKVPKKRGRKSVAFTNGIPTTPSTKLSGAGEEEIELKVSRFSEKEIANWRNNQVDSRQTEVGLYSLCLIVLMPEKFINFFFFCDLALFYFSFCSCL